MNGNVARLRSFLLAMPKPAKIRVHTSEGTEEIKIGRQKFVRVAETILAMDVERVECLDKDDAVIRAKRLDDGEARRSDAAPIPEAIQNDPNAAMLTHCANLIHRAYEHSTEIAFGKLIELVDRIDARSDQIEQRLERTERQLQQSLKEQVDTEYERAQELAERAQNGDQDALSQMASAFLGGMGGLPGMGAPTNGKGST